MGTKELPKDAVKGEEAEGTKELPNELDVEGEEEAVAEAKEVPNAEVGTNAFVPVDKGANELEGANAPVVGNVPAPLPIFHASPPVAGEPPLDPPPPGCTRSENISFFPPSPPGAGVPLGEKEVSQPPLPIALTTPVRTILVSCTGGGETTAGLAAFEGRPRRIGEMVSAREGPEAGEGAAALRMLPYAEEGCLGEALPVRVGVTAYFCAGKE